MGLPGRPYRAIGTDRWIFRSGGSVRCFQEGLT